MLMNIKDFRKFFTLNESGLPQGNRSNYRCHSQKHIKVQLDQLSCIHVGAGSETSSNR